MILTTCCDSPRLFTPVVYLVLSFYLNEIPKTAFLLGGEYKTYKPFLHGPEWNENDRAGTYVEEMLDRMIRRLHTVDSSNE